MKKLIIISLALFLTACKVKTVYIPIETTKTEYKDRLLRDSIYLHDSILVRTKGDTVFFEKYKYLYRDRLIRDSIFKTDSIRVPYPIVEYKDKNYVTGFQNFQIWCGRILILLLIGYFGFIWIKKVI